MSFLSPLAAGYLLDRFLGDPPDRFHPIAALGSCIAALTGPFQHRVASFTGSRTAGALLVLLTVGGTFAVTFILIAAAGQVAPISGWLLETGLTALLLAQGTLGRRAGRVSAALQSGSLEQARKQASHLVGRETAALDEEGVARATIESVAENTVDGVTAPLFYWFIGGLPLAAAYKAVNTLDSMIGYPYEPYREFGWAAARLDDIANWLPTRLTLPFWALAAWMLGYHPRESLQTSLREGRNHPSPNAGMTEAAVAGALGVRLGGRNVYAGRVSNRPVLGQGSIPLAASIGESTALMHTVCHTFLIAGLLLHGLVIQI